MNDDQLLRYARHLLLEDFGLPAQERLLASHALVIGAGGLGSAALLYLASAGVGRITVVDHDTVELSNLQRQIAHTHQRLGQAKVDSARQAMLDLHPGLHIATVAQRADAACLTHWVPQADVVLDATDNLSTRRLLSQACLEHRKPLVSGAAVGWDGQVSVYDHRQPGQACYACLYPPTEHFEEVRCATMGVLAPLVGVIGSTQAALALQLLGTGQAALTQELLMLDGRRMHWHTIKFNRQPQCPVCHQYP